MIHTSLISYFKQKLTFMEVFLRKVKFHIEKEKTNNILDVNYHNNGFDVGRCDGELEATVFLKSQ